MNEKTQIITNDIIQSLDALYNLCSDMSERIGSAHNQNVDAGNEDMALLSDNLTRLQGEVSAFRKQLADSHQDWEQIKSQLLKRTEDTMKAEGNSPPHLYLPRIPVDAVSGQRSRSDTFSFGPQCLAVQAQP